MRGLILISAICMQCSWTYGYPSGPQGVGAFSYQDSAGNRYGSTYQLKDGQVYGTKGENYGPSGNFGFQDVNDFFPEYFRNFQKLLQEAFRDQEEHQKKALDCARKAYDLTSNEAGYIPDFPRFPSPFAGGFPGFSGFPGYTGFAEPSFDMSGFGQNPNSAFASAVAGNGFNHQMAAINPNNPRMPNIDVTSFSEQMPPGAGNYKSVSSSSFVSSSNVNGKEKTVKNAETVVNDNGKVTAYRVQN